MSSTSETEVNFLSHSLPNFSGSPSSSGGRRANWRVELRGTDSLWRPPRSCTRSTRTVFFRHAMKISPGKGRHECMCGECGEWRWGRGGTCTTAQLDLQSSFCAITHNALSPAYSAVQLAVQLAALGTCTVCNVSYCVCTSRMHT